MILDGLTLMAVGYMAYIITNLARSVQVIANVNRNAVMVLASIKVYLESDKAKQSSANAQATAVIQIIEEGKS